MLDQCLWYSGVHVVMRHLIAYAVGAPAERQLRQITRPQHESIVEIGKSEQVICAKSSLHVFESHVIDRLTADERMPKIGQHLSCRWTNIELLPCNAQRPHQP